MEGGGNWGSGVGGQQEEPYQSEMLHLFKYAAICVFAKTSVFVLQDDAYFAVKLIWTIFGFGMNKVDITCF